ncbi:phosphonate ABC transporter, permease protein PhnE [Bifidobacterium sp. DSM 109958]|uniref:Phosphonate ABC transporter, permease protein PhnE n=1 Tax=Bifidobacterium moraviense TaxID=2675323 RepID=A0A7Y0F374_9BIFI|nr:phosphonate ABC transporter, permease protein PhnE [Bifidobacterium sp. DSM 109958]NMN01200.1 phosphonate ABC transporter, permease protein PhnE [Bifidobacterium sp. DSM 109958]
MAGTTATNAGSAPADEQVRGTLITLPSGTKVVKPRSYALPITLGILVFGAFCIWFTGFDPTVLAARGDEFFKILGRMVPPDWSSAGSIVDPLLDTIRMSLLGSFIGTVTAIPFAMIASTTIIHSHIVTVVMRFIFSLIRTLPTIITALVATYIFGLGTLAGTTAIALFTFSYLGKVLYEEIESVDMGPFEAMTALGASPSQAFRYAVLPAIAPSYISNALFCFEGNVRYSAILGYVGAGGLGLILNENLAWREYSTVGMILLELLLTVFVIETTSRAIRRRLE